MNSVYFILFQHTLLIFKPTVIFFIKFQELSLFLPLDEFKKLGVYSFF